MFFRSKCIYVFDEKNDWSANLLVVANSAVWVGTVLAPGLPLWRESGSKRSDNL